MTSDGKLARQGAETLLTFCAGVKPGEKILIAYDQSDDSQSRMLSEGASKLGAVPSMVEISGPVTREPPPSLAKSMLENSVTIFCVNEQRTLLWGHANAKVNALKNGGRVLFLTQALESTPDPSSLEKIRDRSDRLANILESASKVRLETGKRPSTLELKLAGRRALRLSSILDKPGSWGAIPDYAEAAVAPLENESQGELEVDGIIVGLGKVNSPISLRFDSGRLTRISDGEMANAFDKMLGEEPSARVLCELGFGTNHLRKEIKGEFDDKKALGSVHIAMGDNHTFGGENRSSLHIDCLVVQPEIWIDDKLFDVYDV
jgi:leucyl aminopeptidase (aminopeptidase T)